MARKKKSTMKAWEIGAGITAATIAAAAGAYLLSDKKTKAKAKKWVVKARTEVVKHAKTAKKLGRAEYDKLVDQAVKQYGPLKQMTAADIIAAGRQMKGEWTKIQAHAKKLAKARGGAKKTASRKRSSRKTAAKSASKKKRG